MSGKERLEARTRAGSRVRDLLWRALLVIGLAAFLALGLGLEGGWTP